MERSSESGLPIDPVYDDSKLTDFQPETKPGLPAEYPYARGLYPRGYVDRPWMTRQFARGIDTGERAIVVAEQAARLARLRDRRPAAEFGSRISALKKGRKRRIT